MHNSTLLHEFSCTLANDPYADTNVPENHDYAYSKCGPAESSEGGIYIRTTGADGREWRLCV